MTESAGGMPRSDYHRFPPTPPAGRDGAAGDSSRVGARSTRGARDGPKFFREYMRVVEERTRWGAELEAQLALERQRLKTLQAEFDRRGEWAKSLDRELGALRELFTREVNALRAAIAELEAKLKSPCFVGRRL